LGCVGSEIFSLLQDKQKYRNSKEPSENEANDTEGLLLNVHSSKLSVPDKILISPKHTRMTKDNKNGSQLNKP